MLNWNTDEKAFKKKYPKEYKLWRLTQLINYGLDDGEKLDPKEIKASWPTIKNRLDPDRRKTIEFFVWGRRWKVEPGLRADRKNFWQWYFKYCQSLRHIHEGYSKTV